MEPKWNVENQILLCPLCHTISGQVTENDTLVSPTEASEMFAELHWEYTNIPPHREADSLLFPSQVSVVIPPQYVPS